MSFRLLLSSVRALVLTVGASLLLTQAADADGPAKSSEALPSIAAKTSTYQKLDGFLPLYWSAADGKVYLEIPKPDLSLLFLTTLTQGLGSNDVGLDRGQIGSARYVRFERVGTKLLLIQPNLDFRAMTDNVDERRSVEQSFAQSVLFGFKVVAEDGPRVLVDATDFAVRDGHGAIAAIKRAEQGSYKLDEKRSAIYVAGTKAFPRNTEIEATLTFEGDAPGNFIKDVTPTPDSISLRERYSFIALPEPGYQPRTAQPGDGYITVDYADYATAVGEPLIQHRLVRHRLEKKDPTAAVSEAVKPIVYYLDRGAPSPIREALLEGARWWNQAFEAAGYRNAFQVELMPDGVDPLDVRINVIQWVHRATRGWSYGNPVNDPRTGEIIKGNVTLGSLRARYDYLIAEGLLSPYGDDNGIPPELQKLVLARLAQLAAHEIGHTLGLQHNYIASRDGRTSVMDYPQPVVGLNADGSVDLASSYTREIGRWDKVAINYGYRQFPSGTDESAALRGILDDARKQGLGFLTDEDARPAGASHPDVSLWDNGADASAELRHMMAVRKAALARFGERAIRQGRPLASIEEALVPLYLYHRYQIDATAKALGGQRYVYAVRGDGQVPVQPVPAAEQKRALDALIDTLAPDALALSPKLLSLIPPRPPGWPATRELFARSTGLSFDPLAPAIAASTMTMSALLQPERAARLAQQPARDPALPGLDTVIDRLIASTFMTRGLSAVDAQIRRAQQVILVQKLIGLARTASAPVRAHALLALDRLQGDYVSVIAKTSPSTGTNKSSNDERAQARLINDLLSRFRMAPDAAASALPEAKLPPGPPLSD